ncbi:MAG: hypothetical protein HY934_06720 [Candidatus Firestonebacteria bacterium]|nr:hypothetical protein [Candidatus Firestonebacteria bacterium]
MYKCYENGITNGKESFPLYWIISENLLYLSIWILAGYLLWPILIFNGFPLLTIIWIISVLIIQILLKKHNCSGCYYYDKLCHLGWGKLSRALFKQNSGNPDTGMKLSLFYIVPPPLILVISIISGFFNKFSWIYWSVLFIYIILNIVTFPIRKKGCGFCVMRKVCPGSAVKTI